MPAIMDCNDYTSNATACPLCGEYCTTRTGVHDMPTDCIASLRALVSNLREDVHKCQGMAAEINLLANENKKYHAALREIADYGLSSHNRVLIRANHMNIILVAIQALQERKSE